MKELELILKNLEKEFQNEEKFYKKLRGQRGLSSQDWNALDKSAKIQKNLKTKILKLQQLNEKEKTKVVISSDNIQWITELINHYYPNKIISLKGDTDKLIGKTIFVAISEDIAMIDEQIIENIPTTLQFLPIK